MRIIANLPATFTRSGKTYPLVESWTEPARTEQRFAYYNDEEGKKHFLCFNQAQEDWQYLCPSQFPGNAPRPGGDKLNRMSASAELERIMRPIVIIPVDLHRFSREGLQRFHAQYPEIRTHKKPVPNFGEYLIDDNDIDGDEMARDCAKQFGDQVSGWKIPYEYRDNDEIKELLIRLHLKGYAFDAYATWVLFYMPETKTRDVLAGDLSMNMDRDDIIWSKP